MSSIKILGLNAAGVSTSAALLIDGKIVFAVEEERLSREKRTRKFPMLAIRAALDFAKLRLEDLDAVAMGWNPAINLEAFNPAQSQRARFMGEFFYSVPNHLLSLKENNASILSRQTIDFQEGPPLKIYYVNHHRAHASSFFLSPFERAAILSVDAFGEKQCVVFAEGEDNQLKTLGSQDFPHSLGAFYSTMTEFLGFTPQSDEWKLMGASAYGDPRRYYKKLRALFLLSEEGGFQLDLRYFNHYQFPRINRYTPQLIDRLGLQPSAFHQPLTQDYYDLAAAAQRVTEEIYFHLLNQLYSKTMLDRLVLSGGVALNSVANGKILENTPFKEVFISSAPDDSGNSLGAAYYTYHQVLKKPRAEAMSSNFYGPGFTDAEILNDLKKFQIDPTLLENPAHRAAALIASGKIVGWFQGRLEFGDRALGHRSILADPRCAGIKDKINRAVKYREAFRPFAPSILLEYLDEYFLNASPTPFMEKVFPIQPPKRDSIPAVTHVDGTGRLQTVGKKENALFYELIDEFRKLTGIPLILNTSFNLNGEPIVCSPKDAIRTFYSSGLDALIMGNCLMTKKTAAEPGPRNATPTQQAYEETLAQ